MRIDLNASDTELLIEALDFSLASTGMLSPFTRKDRERAKAIKDNLAYQTSININCNPWG